MTATLTTLVSFNGPGDESPNGSLIADSNGDLFGTTTQLGGANGKGAVFEIVKTAGGYASTPTTLVSFNGTTGDNLIGSLVADADGDLVGTTSGGVANGDGAVFEIVKTPAGYASTPRRVVSLNGADGASPSGSLIADSNGDLFGTTDDGGADGDGAVFEIAKTAGGYANTPTTLVSFNNTNGDSPIGGLIADAKGDLFGTTTGGGANDDGTVFEIAKTPAGYASTPTTLLSFNGANGAHPGGSLIADADGDLFGTTVEGGDNGDGTVFEIAKIGPVYADTPTTLVSFNDADGKAPFASLIADADGDLFGTTSVGGGAYEAGTVFEIAKTASGYASTPTTLVSFNNANGAGPLGSLIADSNGDLFGTTAAGGGTVFEIADSGFQTPPVTADILWQNTSGQASIWEMNGNALIGGGPVSPNPGPSWTEIGSGDFNEDGDHDILWQNANGQVSVWEMNGNNVIGGGAVAIAGETASLNPGPTWRAVGTGDFNADINRDGQSDILLQNTGSGQVSIWEMSGNHLIGGGPVSPNPGLAWKAIGTGDFNHDGVSDILWQNTGTGQVSIWEMDGLHVIGGGPVTANPGPAWKAIGTGDFNGDGFSDDILFQNASTGQVSIWEMRGANIVGGGPVSANPGTSWHAIGTSGQTGLGDGGSDILFQNTSGQASIWEMNGNTIAGGGPVNPNPGPTFRAVGLT
jgi:uncharacterized repeat protein (TIGR03803 family)